MASECVFRGDLGRSRGLLEAFIDSQVGFRGTTTQIHGWFQRLFMASQEASRPLNAFVGRRLSVVLQGLPEAIQGVSEGF